MKLLALLSTVSISVAGCSTPLIDRQAALSQKSGSVLKSTADVLDSVRIIALRAELIGGSSVMGWGTVPTAKEAAGQKFLLANLCSMDDTVSPSVSVALSYPRAFSKDERQLAIVSGFQGALDTAAKAPSDQKLSTLAKSIFSGDVKSLTEKKTLAPGCEDELQGIMNGRYQSFPPRNAEAAAAPTGDIIPIIGDVIKLATSVASVWEKDVRDARIQKFANTNAERVLRGLGVDPALLTQTETPKAVSSPIANVLMAARQDQMRFYLWSAVQDLNEASDTTTGTITDLNHRIAGDRLASDLAGFNAAYSSDAATAFNALALTYVTYFRCAREGEQLYYRK